MADAVLELLLKARDEGGAAFASFGGHISGLSKHAKSATADTEELAGKKGGGLGSLAGSLTGLVSPLGLVTAGIGATVGVGLMAFDTYKKDEVQIKALDISLTDHGMNVAQVTAAIDAQKGSYEALGYTVEETRPAFTQLTEAGLTQSQMMTAMGPIMDLARAKNISLTDASTMFTQAMMGSGKALKGYGILLPPVSAAAADVGKATANAAKAHDGLKLAQEQLVVTEDSLKGKHTLTAAEALKLQQAHDKVTTAEEKVKTAQAALTLAQQGGIDKGARQAIVIKDIELALKDHKKAIDENAPIMAKLSDDWNQFSEFIGPLVEKAFHGILEGISALADFIDQTVVPALKGLLGILGNIIDAAQKALGFLGNVLFTKTPGTIGNLTPGGAAAAGGSSSSVGGLGGMSVTKGKPSGALPGYASGGMVPGPLGSPQLAIVHGGETVTPAGGIGAATFHPGAIIVNGAGDPAATAQAVMLALKRELTRQNTSLASGY